MASWCTDSLSPWLRSRKHSSIFSLLLILMFLYKSDASTSLHTRPFEPKFNQGCSCFCVDFLQRQQKGFSLFCLLFYFLSAFLHLSASSCSEPLTGNICGVSQLMFKAAQWGDRLGCMRSLTKLWSACETALQPSSCARLCGCKSVFALTDLFPGIPACLHFRPGLWCLALNVHPPIPAW